MAGSIWGAVMLWVIASVAAVHPVAAGTPTAPPRPAPSAGYAHRIWTEADGLPTLEINDVLQTREGLVWLATEAGLVRFDGREFRRFDGSKFPAFGSNRCTRLAEGSDGALWIGTVAGLIRHQAGGFARFGKEEGLPDAHVTALCVRANGELWAGTNEGPARWEVDRFVPVRWEWPFTTKANFTVLMLKEDDTGCLWFSDMSGARRWLDQSQAFEPPLGDQGYVPWAHDLIRSPTGTLHSLGQQHQVWDGEMWVFYWSLPRPQPQAGMAVDREQRVWYVLEDRQLASYEEYAPGSYAFRPEPRRNVRLLRPDAGGGFWISSDLGLELWRPAPVQQLTPADGLPHENTWALLEDRAGDIWVGTDNGVCRVHPGTSGNAVVESRLENESPFEKIRALFEDAEAALWVGSGGGLLRWDSAAFGRNPLPGGYGANKVRCLAADAEGRLWVGAEAGLLFRQGNEWHALAGSDALSGAEVRCLHPDRRGTLWAGTAGHGVFCLRNGRVVSHFTEAKDGLSSDRVWAIHEADDGTLWLATADGLTRYREGCFRAFHPSQGLVDTAINAVVSDARGDLWLSSDHGLGWVSRASLEAVAAGGQSRLVSLRFGVADGMPDDEANGQKSHPAILRDRRGRIWVPTTRGVAIVDPERALAGGPLLTPLIRSVSALGSVMAKCDAGWYVTSPDAALEAHDGAPDVVLPPGSGTVLSFDCLVPEPFAPAQTRMRYRLRGHSEEWLEDAGQAQVHFTRVKPGSYRFEALAADPNGRWGDVPVVLGIVVTPFFHQTRTFAALVLLGVVGTVGSLLRWRDRTLRRVQRAEAEARLLRERERIARDMHDDLGARMHEVLLLARQATGAPKPHTATGRPLSVAVGEAVRGLEEIVWAVQPGKDNIAALVAQLTRCAREQAALAGIAFEADLPEAIPDQALPGARRQNLYLIIREALRNTLRHAEARSVRLRVARENEWWEIQMEDDGQGFDVGASTSQGNGLANMRQRAREAGADLRIDSSPDAGARVTLRFRMNAGNE